MMKRGFSLALIFLIAGAFLSSFVFAVDIAGQVEGSTEKFEQTATSVNNFFYRPDVRAEFLKEKWNTFSTTNAFGKVLLVVHNFLIENKEVFSFLLGVPYSFSWKFFLTFFFWIYLISFFFKIFDAFFMFFMSKYVSIVKPSTTTINKLLKSSTLSLLFNICLLFVLIVIFSSVRLPLFLAWVVEKIFSSDQSSTMRVIMGLLVILFFYLLNLLSSYMEKFAEMQKKINIENVKDEHAAETERKVNGAEGSGEDSDVAFAREYLKEFGKILREED